MPGDLRENESRIFLREGLDRFWAFCPSGSHTAHHTVTCAYAAARFRRIDAEDCVLIAKLTTDPNKQELLARPTRHHETSALEMERTIAKSISKDQARRPHGEMPNGTLADV